jgi:hypothetical protein
MRHKLFIIKFIHSLIFWWQVICLGYLLFACITASFNILVLLAIISILLNGILLLINKGRCPFTTLSEREGAKRGSVTDIFLPEWVARHIFRVAFPVFIIEIIVLATRYFTGI